MMDRFVWFFLLFMFLGTTSTSEHDAALLASKMNRCAKKKSGKRKGKRSKHCTTDDLLWIALQKYQLPDKTQSLYWYEEAANAGSVDAMTIAATMYFRGQAGEVNYKKAFKLAKQASDRGSASGMLSLGSSYLHGLGVVPNETKAVEFFAQGHQNEMFLCWHIFFSLLVRVHFIRVSLS